MRFQGGHDAFIKFSLLIAALAGTTLGLWMLLSWLGWVSAAAFSTILTAHGQLQVYGFVTLYTMGVAMMILPRFLQTSLKPTWLVNLCLPMMIAGIALNLDGPGPLGVALQMLSTTAFFLILRITRRSAPPAKKKKDPLSREHALFLACGTLWLLAAQALSLVDLTRSLETALWGFAGLYIAGIGLRVHPGMLGIKGLHKRLLLPAAALWNLALVLLWTGPEGLWCWVLAGGVGLFLLSLRPFRRASLPPAGGAWLRYYVRTSYAWLTVAVLLSCWTQLGHQEWAGPARHALGSGFVLTMMMGMGLRMIPAFEVRRLLWGPGPWALYAVLTLGTLLRVWAQGVGATVLLAFGGALQFIAIVGFVILLVGTSHWGKKLHYEGEMGMPLPTPSPDAKERVDSLVSIGT